MSANDWFKELDPLIQWKEDETSMRDKIPSEQLIRDPFESKDLLDDSLMGAASSRGRMQMHNEDRYLMYQIIESVRKENIELREEMRQRDRCREQEMEKLMSRLTELTLTQEERKPPPALSSSLGSPNPVISGEKELLKSLQSESGKERSDEDNKREHSTDSQAQIKKEDKGNRPPVLIKPATYDGKSSWLDYKSHFEACATLGHWSEEDKAMYLAVSLRRQAQSVLGDLAGRVPKKYEELITALNERFSPPNQMELHRAQLRERKQRATDSLPELGQSIRRLTNLAYPTAPYDVRETLSKEYFIDALIDSDIRLRIKQS